ncbi:3'-5' exonuclease [Venenivibrio stagnispumantis]|uniref:DNA polymerase-3 subunit epsilon n=1 Tax=Venenivibrio stagnispumantis TaxID=407998 RepID=A0AA46AF22_9AQUI|nr:3'-5' exonuclease [Venenivibrio stagnispumantis]MCW4573582.1 3'-5' exonuclease [Venenivibrio stagnispumantis]SMP16719.1 DNA polymerase-3 subunit epsilon [Venenivibrio stagnispumantis]
MYNLSIDEVSFAVIDIETTGLKPTTGEIIEVAAIKVEGGVITSKFSSLVKPDIQIIPPHITQLTGITTAMVIDKPKIEEIFDKYMDFIGDSIIVAHNASFDLSFLNLVNNRLYGKNIQNPTICTLKLARRIFPELQSKSLSNLAYHFNLSFQQRHRALSDAYATYEIFKRIIDILQDYKINKVLDIIKLANGKEINLINKRRRYV